MMRRTYLAIATFTLLACVSPARRITLGPPPPAPRVPGVTPEAAGDAGEAGLPPPPPLPPRQPAPRGVPSVAVWGELGPPQVLRARPSGRGSGSDPSFLALGDGPEPFGVVLIGADRLEVWTPSSPEPIATRALTDLSLVPDVTHLVCSGAGLVLVDTERDLVALSAETLRTLWRRAKQPEDRWLRDGDCAISRDLVVLNWLWMSEHPPPPARHRTIGIDLSGNERFVVQGADGPPHVVGEHLYLGGGGHEGLAAIDARGAVRWSLPRRNDIQVPVGDVVVTENKGEWQILSARTGELVKATPAPRLGTRGIRLDPGGASESGILYSFLATRAVGGVAQSALLAWDTATGAALWTTRGRASFLHHPGRAQITRGEILYYDDEDDEIVAVDKAAHTEKWYWPLGHRSGGRFAFVHDGAPALVVEDDLAGRVLVFRPGNAPPLARLELTGRTRWRGKPLGGAQVRARGATTIARADGTFSLEVEARGPFTLYAQALGIGPLPCRNVSGAQRYDPAEPWPVDVEMNSECEPGE